MKRFKYTKHSRSKIDTYVEFPITDLDMTPYTCGGDTDLRLYDLYSIIVHHGTFGSGHFLAYIWSPVNESWFEMNDSHVKPTTPEVVYRQSAYMLFYLRRDVNQRMKDLDSLDLIADTLSSVSSVHVKTSFPNTADESYYSSPADSVDNNLSQTRRSNRLLNQPKKSAKEEKISAFRRSKRKRSLSLVISSDSD